MKKFLLTFLAVMLAFSLCGCVFNREEPFDPGDMSTWFSDSPEGGADAEAARGIVTGMSFQEIVDILGKPQREVGKDMWIMQWELSDGRLLNVSFGMADPNVAESDRRKGDIIVTDIGVTDKK